MNIAHITDAADNRMRTRTALEQLQESQRQLAEKKPDEPAPDADDESARQQAIRDLWSV